MSSPYTSESRSLSDGLRTLATPQQVALELAAVELLGDPAVQEAQQAVARYWIDKVGPSSELKSRFDREFEQVVFCSALNALNADPMNPKIHAFGRFAHHNAGVGIPGTKAGHPNPDYVYRFIPVNDQCRYVISGIMPEHGPVAFEVGLIDQDQVYLATLSAHELVIGPDNRFAITVDPEPANGRVHHMRSSAGACQIIIRDVLADVSVHCPCALSVERIDDCLPSPNVSEDTPTIRFAAAIRAFVDDLSAATEMLVGGRKPNDFVAPAFNDRGTYLVTQAYSPGRFLLGDDEALVLTLTLGNAAYAVVPVSNEWGGINDFLHHVGCLGTGRAKPNPDGSFTFVVSIRDPGVYNWVDTDGQHEGILCVRWAGFDPRNASVERPGLSARWTTLDKLTEALPQGCPMVTATQRAEQLERHRLDYLGAMGA